MTGIGAVTLKLVEDVWLDLLFCSKGYFVDPTIVVVDNPQDKMMKEEIFGPVLSVYVYKNDEPIQTEGLVDKTTPFALTGAIFAEDR